MLVTFKIQREEAIDCNELDDSMKDEVSKLIRSEEIKSPEKLYKFVERFYGVKLEHYVGENNIPELCELFGDSSIDIDRSQDNPEESWSNGKYTHIGISKNNVRNVRKGESIALMWSIIDVIDTANKSGIKISEEQASEVLLRIDDNHDANEGVNWVVIDTHVNMYASDYGLKKYKFLNHYQCDYCNISWEDVSDHSCNGKCPSCNKEYSPYESEEI